MGCQGFRIPAKGSIVFIIMKTVYAFVLLLLLYTMLSCSTREVVVFTDPVFARAMNAADGAQLSSFLSSRGYKLRPVDLPFDTPAENMIKDIEVNPGGIYGFTPGLTPSYREIKGLYPDVALFLVEDVSSEPAGLENAAELLNNELKNEEVVIIAGKSLREELPRKINDPENQGHHVFFWHSAADEPVFREWLQEFKDAGKLVFLSEDVPASILKLTLSVLPVEVLYHDCVDAEFLERLTVSTDERIVFIGRNYNEVLRNALEGILSTRAAGNGMNPD